MVVKELYTVWVGGAEVNDQHLSKEMAEKLANEYRTNGYDDVIVEMVNTKG